MKCYELTTKQWKHIKPLLPPEETGKWRRPRKDNRTMLNGMLWMTWSGSQWMELLETYSSWQSVYAHFAKYQNDGTLKRVSHALSENADTENLSINSNCIKVHESANGGGKRRIKQLTIPEVRWIQNSTLLGNPTEFLLSDATDHDCIHTVDLLKKVEISGSNVLEDRAYGTQNIWDYISEHGVSFAIPLQSNISKPWPVD